MHEDLRVSATLVVPGSELDWAAVRAGGPGGQNVNKVSTKVELRFDPRSTSLPERVSTRLRALARNRLDADGRIVITCAETRSQAKNVELARERLAELIRAALVVPRKRKATRPSAAAGRRRVQDKRMSGDKKRERRKPDWD